MRYASIRKWATSRQPKLESPEADVEGVEELIPRPDTPGSGSPSRVSQEGEVTHAQQSSVDKTFCLEPRPPIEEVKTPLQEFEEKIKVFESNPVLHKMLKSIYENDDSLGTTINLKCNQIGNEEAKALAEALKVNI
jgi:hypothetical protein